MNDAYRAKLESYLASMMQAKKMLLQEILTPEDYAKIDTIIAEKYGISSCSLYRGINLIYSLAIHTFKVTIPPYRPTSI